MNDRPPGAAEGWENWIPLWGSLKNSVAYFMDGRPGWGVFWGVMSIADALLVGRLATGLVGLAEMGVRSVLEKVGLEVVCDSVLRSYPTFRYVGLEGAELAGRAVGKYDVLKNTIYIADHLVGDDLVATVRHELLHWAGDTGGIVGKTVNIIAYSASDALRFAEEFLAEYYGTGGLWHSLVFAGGYVNPVKLIAESGVYVARISVNIEQALLSHGVQGVI